MIHARNEWRAEQRGCAPQAGFTLMEIVLALALTSVVTYLLMTAVELFVIRIETSRGRVESSQIARTILDQMADDIASLRIDPPRAAASPGSGSGAGGGTQAGGGGGSAGASQGAASGQGGAGGAGTAGGQAGAGNAGGVGSGSATGGNALAPATLHGIFGNAEELRIDRAAPQNWARASREVDPTEPAAVGDFPRTVRYYLGEGTGQTSQELAKQGVTVEEEPTANAAGLYREVIPTTALADDSDPLASPASREGARVELLAPEVVKLEFHYFDGQQLVDEWDVAEDGGLPKGVEILLTINQPDYGPQSDAEQQRRTQTGQNYREKDLVVYRRFVRIPAANPPQAAELLLPQAQNGGAQPAQGNAGAGNNGGGNGGNNAAGGNGQGGQGGQGGQAGANNGN
ncbi:hypothetical protein PLANPX_2005 [Lacipirellula parvula]|uniref:Type II secretion system protein J n=2 Tax=Lacipirellula parvula TaxID=2650471 RepID=A0A5K7XDK1_9BACT|nr:prepilin-type N-terminal cleavage/methylation domain-containing protein [Lacipirellula parvula]BBO32393.1 hypothetical protein PLANPX_2005 [Lacipirellula parvula]